MSPQPIPAPDESGEYPASNVRMRTVPERGLDAALRYWPSRWPQAIVLAAMTLEPFARELTPPEWADALDRLVVATCGVLADLTRFG